MKKRIFIALNLPKTVKEELIKLISQTKKINSKNKLIKSKQF